MFVFPFTVNILLTFLLCKAHNQNTYDHLLSWSNVLSFELTPNKDSSESFSGILTTDNSEVGTIRMSLHLLIRPYTHEFNGDNNVSPLNNNFCLYEGLVIHKMNGNRHETDTDNPVRLRYCNNELQGFFRFQGKTFHLDQDRGQRILHAQEQLEQDSQLENENCGVQEKFFEPSVWHPKKSFKTLKRGGATEDKPERFYKIQVTVNHEFGYYGGIDRNRSNQEIIDRVHTVMDLANLIFSTLKKVILHLVVVDIEIFTQETDPVPEGETSLKALTKWRKENRKNRPDSDALINFVAKGRDMGGNAGLAYVGTVCGNRAVCWMTDNWTRSKIKSASVAVHELMHVLGFHHIDKNMNDPCGCHYHDCVMRGGVTPYADYNVFTDCQEEQLLQKFTEAKYDCLEEKPDVPIYEPYCGDGAINQDWEECDCRGNCDHKCCTEDCRLRQDGDLCFANGTHQSTCVDNKCLANCNAYDVCCDSSTRFAKPVGALCDPHGTLEDICGRGKCDGVTTDRCPVLDKKNGDDCSLYGFEGQCYKGNCKSFEIQCASIFGASVVRTNMPDACFKKNKDGTEYGNCGYQTTADGTEIDYTACGSNNKRYRCGKLFCSLNTTDPRSLIHVPTAEQVKLYPFDIDNQKCYSVSSIITSDGVDASYTANGTPCNPEGTDKFCMNGKCKLKKNIKDYN